MELTIFYIITLAVWGIVMLFTLRQKRVSDEMERQKSLTSEDENLPPLSVIVTTRNQELQLKQHLPLMLNQIYPHFEVIVVDISSTDNTKKLLEEMEADHTNLRHTFTPATGRDISRERLAITLGVKASCNDWFVVTQADCCPISHLWLRRIGEAIANHRSAEMVLGYTRFRKVTGYKSQRISFERLWTQLFNLGFVAQQGGYRADATNLAYKKALFNAHQGFASGSNLLEGATDIMVNQNSTCHNTTTCLHPDAIMEQDLPSRESYWHHHRLFFKETSRHFTHTMGYKMHYHSASLMHLLMAVCLLATMVLSAINEHYAVTGTALLAWVGHFAMQGMLLNRTIRLLHARGLSYTTIGWFTHLVPLWDLQTWLSHLFANKQQFRKKYI